MGTQAIRIFNFQHALSSQLQRLYFDRCLSKYISKFDSYAFVICVLVTYVLRYTFFNVFLSFFCDPMRIRMEGHLFSRYPRLYLLIKFILHAHRQLVKLVLSARGRQYRAQSSDCPKISAFGAMLLGHRCSLVFGAHALSGSCAW